MTSVTAPAEVSRVAVLDDGGWTGDPTEHPAYRTFAELVAEVIAPRAVEVDATEVPASHIDALREIGYFAWSVPEEFGGSGLPAAVQNAANNLLFGADPSTATIVTQHFGPVLQALKTRTPEALALLPQLAAGERIGGAGFGHVRSWPARRGTTATKVAGGYLIDGVVGWISGLGLVDTIWLGAVDEEREAYVFGIGDLRGAVTEPIALRLAAVQGSRTGSLRLENLFLPDAYVSEVVDVAEWKARDGLVSPVAAARASQGGSQGGSGPAGTLPMPGAYGLARAALDDALALHPGEPSLLALSRELEAAVATPLPELEWRSVLDELAVRATTAGVVARGGGGLLLDDIAQVRARAAQFLQIRAIGPRVRAAHLRRYVRS